jgi:hypothetical protein
LQIEALAIIILSRGPAGLGGEGSRALRAGEIRIGRIRRTVKEGRKIRMEGYA